MPMDRSRYPPNWEEISQSIKDRAGWRCEWCDVPHGAIGARDTDGNWHNERDIHLMNSDQGYNLFGEFPKMIKIILTVAHLGTDHPDGTPGDKTNKMDVRPDNLAALCQKCHLNYDRDEHAANAARTRRQRLIDAGQMELF